MAFWWLIEFDKQNYTRELNTKYSIVARANLLYMAGTITQSEFKRQIEGFSMPVITDHERKNAIISAATTLEEISADFGSSAILNLANKNYLKIAHNDTLILLEDDQFDPNRYIIIRSISAIVLTAVLAAYIFIIRKIRPLRRLKRQIDRFGAGDLDIKDTSKGSDEISEVAKAFYAAAAQIRALGSSRQLFLRNIMHELKTPITKGRITAEMLGEDKYKARLIAVFERLESLINEFAAVERATSGILVQEKALYKSGDIIDEALDIAMINSDNIIVSGDTECECDFHLMAIAAKNMIDNALKYSTNNKVLIECDSDEISFISLGEPLSEPLDHYIKPFIQGANRQKGFGLGLYIVDNILKAHGFDLAYCYENGKNIFSFKLAK